jgi:hypothetical protein
VHSAAVRNQIEVNRRELTSKFIYRTALPDHDAGGGCSACALPPRCSARYPPAADLCCALLCSARSHRSGSSSCLARRPRERRCCCVVDVTACTRCRVSVVASGWRCPCCEQRRDPRQLAVLGRRWHRAHAHRADAVFARAIHPTASCRRCARGRREWYQP